jgi:hypothetical protein
MPHRLYPQVARRAGSRCEYCKAPEAVSPDLFQVEHVWRRVRGGPDEIENLALSCPPCNRRKSSATHAIDPITGTAVPLFNPRRDDWRAHFRIDRAPAAFTIVGLTPTGRATVHRLGMNDSHTVSARVLWALAKLFPP